MAVDPVKIFIINALWLCQPFANTPRPKLSPGEMASITLNASFATRFSRRKTWSPSQSKKRTMKNLAGPK